MSNGPVQRLVREYILRLPPQTAFTPAELIGYRLGSADAVRQALCRLVRSGEIFRIQKGYYQRVPPVNRHGTPPSVHDLAHAFARKLMHRKTRKHEAYTP